jgi:N-acetyl-anhydromuramoyl-L-alanine amidase
MQTLPTQSLWIDGWYRFARRLASPNFGVRPDGTVIDLVVIHSISLPPAQTDADYGGGFVQQFFTNQLDWDAHPYFDTIRGQQVSAHFFIERTGALWQFVSCHDRAWHAGVSIHIKNGVEKNNCNDFSIGIELEGVPGDAFTDAQYESLSSLNAALSHVYSGLDFVGHEHIAPGRKDDPGSGFDWLRLRRDIGADF